MKLGFSLTWKNFYDDEEVQEEVMTWFKRQTTHFYDSRDTEAGSKT
jgi:hypothetical protein